MTGCNVADWGYFAIYVAIAVGVLILGVTSPWIHARHKAALRREVLDELDTLRGHCAECRDKDGVGY